MSTESNADIVEIILRLAQAEGLSADAAHQIEQLVRTEHGGERVRIAKRKKHLTDAQRAEVYADGLSNQSTEEIAGKYGISRATLYRYMKRGG